MNNYSFIRYLGMLSVVLLFSACTPKVGSEEWCVDMKEKPKGEWTLNQASAFTEYCLF